MTKDGGLLPGSYATTAADAAYVKTGMDAVRRSALPNPTPAIYEFEIRPPARTVIKEGIVQPANGQPGGGVEVYLRGRVPCQHGPTRADPAGDLMARIKLPQRWIDFLLSQPETGMGYQRVAVVLRSGRVLSPSVVYNAEELEPPQSVSIRVEDIEEIRVERKRPSSARLRERKGVGAVPRRCGGALRPLSARGPERLVTQEEQLLGTQGS